jgi:hypothetical protein
MAAQDARAPVTLHMQAVEGGREKGTKEPAGV